MRGALDLPVHLARVTPRKVIKLPECVAWQHKIPHGQRAEVDQHPEDVGPAVGGEDDEDGGETEDHGEEDQGDDGDGFCDDRDDDCFLLAGAGKKGVGGWLLR